VAAEFLLAAEFAGDILDTSADFFDGGFVSSFGTSNLSDQYRNS